MSFASQETSRTQGKPDTLYRFSLSNATYAYTDSEEAIEFGGITYLPIPIDRDTITASGSLDKSQLKINVPHDTPVAELFKIYPPSEVVGVTIFQGHDGDPDDEFLAIYVGRVLSAGRADSKAALTCEPFSTSAKRPMLRRNFMLGCPHALYGDQCRADRASKTFTLTVMAIGKSQLAFADGWEGAYTAANYRGGLVEWNNAGRTELRTILRAQTDTNVITMSGQATGLVPGSTVRVSLGCNHKLLNGGDCQTVFNNAPNYGGQPWIPTDNPVAFVNRFE